MPAEPVSVLVADDHPLYRTSLERAVGAHPQLGLTGSVGDGRAALAIMREEHPAVAIVDLHVPGLDGTQLLDAAQREELPTRVIMLTGHLENDTVFRAVELGAAAVLSKLIEPVDLTDAILAVARGETIFSGEVQAIVAGELRARRQDDRPMLTPREREILERIAAGETVATMAAAIHLSPSTVKSHVESLYRKLGVADRGAAVAVAMRRGLLH